MKAVCSKNELSYALTAICRIIPARTNIPILNGCLIKAKNQTLILRCTDQELTLEIYIPAQVEEEGGTVVLAKHFSDLVRRLSDDQVFLSYSAESKLMEIRCGAVNSRLCTWMADDYSFRQKKPDAYKVNFSAGRWKRCTNKVLVAAAQQDVRINYAGVYISFNKEQIRMVATDAYRLAFIRMFNNSGVTDSKLFIPGRAVNEVNRLASSDDDLEICWDGGTVCFETQYFLLTSRLINSQFLNYEKFIPGEPELEVVVLRETLLTALERASLFISINEHFAIACLKVEGDKLIISAQAVEVGSLDDVIFLDVPAVKQAEASFNAKYLLEPLQVMDQEKVTLRLNGSNGPIIYLETVEDEYCMHLVSPVCRTV